MLALLLLSCGKTPADSGCDCPLPPTSPTVDTTAEDTEPQDTDPPSTTDSTPPVDTDTAETAETADTGDSADTGLAPDVLDVYLLAGQSNMVGYSQESGLPPSLRVSQDDVRMYRSGEPWWRSLEPASDIPGYFGPEVTFGRTLADADATQRSALIKHAVGGTDLYSYWYPGEATDDPNMGDGYRVFIATVRDGLAALDEAGEDWRIAGMIWMQGESDAFSAETANSYDTNLERLIARVREDVSAPEMPFVAGLIDCPACPAEFRDRVRLNTTVVADASDTVSTIETEDLLGQPDGYHYTGVGMRVMGERFAQTLLGTDLSPAPTPAVTLTGTYRTDYTGDYVVGYAFSLSREVVVTDLGLFDVDANGLPDSAQVGLWRQSDASLLSMATVPASVTEDSSFVGGFRYVGVEPVTLPSGDYIVASQSFLFGERYLHNAAIAEADAVTWLEGRHNVGSALAYPTITVESTIDDALWFGASFLYSD